MLGVSCAFADLPGFRRQVLRFSLGSGVSDGELRAALRGLEAGGVKTGEIESTGRQRINRGGPGGEWRCCVIL